MITLSRIVLVNWYTFSTQDIDVRGSIGLFGPNGAGKSSILDAIQVVLTGNNSNHLSLNASSNQNTGRRKTEEKRSVRDYCLGKVQGEVLRTTSITYVALVFERPRDGRVWTIGIGLSAREQDVSEEILCAFIAPDQSLRAKDFLGESPAGRYPLPHEDLLVTLKRVAGFENFGHRPTNFTKHILSTLRAKTGYIAEPKRFLTAIKNALRFTDMESANQFVRTFLLDDDKIDIDTLRSSVATWRGFQEKIEKLEAQKIRVCAAIDEYNELIAKLEDEKRLRWVERKAERDRVDHHLSSLRRENAAKQIELTELEVSLASTRARKQATSDEIKDIRRSLATDERELAIKSFQLDLGAAEKGLNDVRARHAAYLAMLGSSASILAHLVATYGKDEYARAKAACEALVSRMDSETSVSSRDIDSAVRGTVEPLEAYVQLVDDAYVRSVGERAQIQLELEHTQEQLRDIIEGKALIGRTTQALVERLAAEGIEAVPLSNLVEVVNEDWRDAVETFLGPAREALIVDPLDARDATSYLRKHRRDFIGCQVVNTTKTHEISAHAQPDSLAAILATEDPHVRAFLNRRLNSVVRVDTDEELLRVDRGITMECLTAAGGSIEARRHADRHLLGKDTLARNRPLLETRIAELERQLDHVNRKETDYRGLLGSIRSYLTGIATSDGLFALENALKNANEKCLALGDNIRTLESERPAEIRQRLTDLEADLKGLEEDEVSDEREVRKAQFALAQVQTSLNSVEEDARSAEEAFAAVDHLSQAEHEDCVRVFASLLGQFENLAAVRNAARDSALLASRRAQTLAGSAPRLAEIYGRDYEVAGWDEAMSHGQALAWLVDSRTVVENHHLTQYRDKVESARVAMEEALRSDLLLKLHSRIESAKSQITGLSRQLRTRVFHRERYEFQTKPNPAFHDIVQVAKRIYENAADVSTLFRADADLDGDVARGVAKIRAMLESGDDVSEISDYRNYLQFELVTRRIEDDEIASEYSKRQGTGSGGEKQVPFYIAISCAVSNVCHHRETQRDNLGLGLVMFDEAFNKLDGPNTGACLSLMNEFNLQALVSAPTEKQLTFMEHMDTIISVNRIGTHCQIDVEYPTDFGRDMFRQSNPANVPLEQFLLERSGAVPDAAE